jgi:uncharacterized metal-binding protein
MRCAECEDRSCEKGRDCSGGLAPRVAMETYRGGDLELLQAAAGVEAEHYMEATRLEEVALMAKKLGVERIGIAFCIGLAQEARWVSRYLGKFFSVSSVCCKVGGVSKDEFDLQHLRGEGRESTCNPAGQAAVLAEADTQLNVVVGLCVGHDSQFYRSSVAPVVTLAAKDRVLAHNPLGAIYSRYHRETKLGISDDDDTMKDGQDQDQRRNSK